MCTQHGAAGTCSGTRPVSGLTPHPIQQPAPSRPAGCSVESSAKTQAVQSVYREDGPQSKTSTWKGLLTYKDELGSLFLFI